MLRIRRDDGPGILTFTEAGGLARSGLNAAGVAITANYLESDRGYRQMGVPLAFLRRKVLEQEHVALAMRAVYCTPKSASNNMTVSCSGGHAGGVAINFECAPDETLQVHAKHTAPTPPGTGRKEPRAPFCCPPLVPCRTAPPRPAFPRDRRLAAAAGEGGA